MREWGKRERASNQCHGQLARKLRNKLRQTVDSSVHLLKDVLQDVAAPAGGGAKPESIVEVAPFHNNNCAFGRLFTRTLEIAFHIAKKAGSYHDVIGWEPAFGMGHNERLKVQWRKSAHQVNFPWTGV